MAASIADTARKASAGTWRKPRMKVYDYNQVRKKLLIGADWHVLLWHPFYLGKLNTQLRTRLTGARISR